MGHKSLGQNPTDPIRDIRHVRAIKNTLKANKKYKQYLFFTLAINSGLRVSDLLSLKVGDLWNIDEFPCKEFTLRTQKTRTFTPTPINDAIVEAMKFSKDAFPLYDLDAPLFSIDRRTAGRWVKKWCHDVGLDKGIYAAHTLRKTFGYQLWLQNGKSFEALLHVSEALGHRDVSTTLRYLGIRREQISKWQRKLNL